MSLEDKRENKNKNGKSNKIEKSDKSEKGDLTKNILNKVSYFINKKLNNINFNKIDNINENVQILLNEYEKQNKYLNNKINVLESLLILMNKDMNDLKKKIKNKNFVCSSNSSNNLVNSNSSNNLSPKYDNKKELDFNNISLLNHNEENELSDLNEFINIQKNNDLNEFINIEENNNLNEFINIEENNNLNELINIEENNNLNELNNIEKNKLNQEIPIIKVNSFSNFYIDIKKEKLELDNSFIKKCLESHTINADLKIFKKIYIEEIPNSCYSIRTIKGNYQYWLNNKMNDDDENGTYIKDIIIHNISNAYLEANNFDHYLQDNDLFIKNQEYILDMNKQKYKDKLFNNILKIIKE